ncbi:glycosyltransferase, group 1 domain protein [Parvimonas sp. oral taxon 393 str. F0440]|nr:glycosyltransferase, group 1 domain protein [Parvimonas sp. oral taxon 393 str. F0440]
MDLMFSMSKQEGFSGAIVEGLALGVPFISTDVGGVKELSNNGKFGRIVNSIDEACENIVDFFETCRIADKSEMKNFITKFTIPEQIKNINEIIE